MEEGRGEVEMGWRSADLRGGEGTGRGVSDQGREGGKEGGMLGLRERSTIHAVNN